LRQKRKHTRSQMMGLPNNTFLNVQPDPMRATPTHFRDEVKRHELNQETLSTQERNKQRR